MGSSGLIYAANAVLVTPWWDPRTGAGAIKRYEEGLRCAFPWARISVICEVVRGGTAAVEWEFEGINVGAIVARGGVVEPTHRPLRLRGASFVRFNAHGLVAEEHRYYDVASVLEQLGILTS